MNKYETEHLEKIYPGLAECVVLLKKDGGFPLEKPGKIAAYGSGVRHTIKGGTGSGEVNSRFFVTVEQGLEDAGFEITTGPWLDAYDEILVKARERFVSDVKARAKKEHKNPIMAGMGAVMPQPEYGLPLDGDGDACIYVLSRISGEGNDRIAAAGDFLLSETEVRDILALDATFEKFMLVLNVGGPVDLTPVAGVKNILLLSQLGVETGRAMADILLGKAYPSGKLASTWGRMEDYPDVGNFGETNDTLYREGIYVGYRWFDAAGRKAAYPFGYGLGYTEFAVKGSRVSLKKTVVTVTADVENVGTRPGRETLQVYVSCPWGKLDKPKKDLAAFKKSGELAAGESVSVTVDFDLSVLASYDEDAAAYVLEKGRYTVLVGTSSEDLVAVAALDLDESVVVRQVKNLLGKPDFTDWRPQGAPFAKLDDGIPVLSVKSSDFVTETVSYEPGESVDEQISALSDNELCLMNMGAFDARRRASVIGNAASTVAGAAGETTGAVPGVPVVVMSDGPAGLRLSEKYYKDEKGAHPFGPAMPETMMEFASGLTKLLIGGTPKLPKGAELLEQYCTAIPIGTALAQSWNPDFAKTCGDMVGAEMETFGVDLWLAPALNIHRSPLCGRNFEYFSEDPLVSGVFAAALTGGVQSHPGRGVTIKHFAANNQETNRYFSNSVVSERALREIYLKGFSICIRTAHPMAVMTSYNLINGTHTSESRELCTDVLRREFGFDGLCMTDWVMQGMEPLDGSVYAAPDPAVVAAAGCDIFMPGSRKDFQMLQNGLKEGKVDRRQLEINAQHVKDVKI